MKRVPVDPCIYLCSFVNINLLFGVHGLHKDALYYFIGRAVSSPAGYRIALYYFIGRAFSSPAGYRIALYYFIGRVISSPAGYRIALYYFIGRVVSSPAGYRFQKSLVGYFCKLDMSYE